MKGTQQDFLRLPVNPISVNPPTGYRDIRWSPGSDSPVVRGPNGVETPLGGGDATWGAISGNIADQTDLTAAIAAAAGGAIDITAAPYNAVGDGMRVDNAVVSGTAVTAAGFNFTSRVGNYVLIPGAGTAGADHISTIAAGANGSFTLQHTAPTAIGANAKVFFGTNNTTAIQAAIDAAGVANSTIRKVYFPPGVYICNLDIPTEITLEGAGMGALSNFDVPITAFLQNRAAFPTVLIPAITTAPVLKFDNIYGNSTRNLMVCGSVRRNGRGIQVGDPTNGAVAYTGSNAIWENVVSIGFQYSFISASAVDMVFNSCIFTDSTTCVHLGELTGGVGPTDNCIFNACIMGGPASTPSDYCIYQEGCKGIVINGGDYNHCGAAVYMAGGGTCTVNGINCEAATGSPFQVAAGTLVINNATLATPAAPAISALGSSVSVSVSALSMASPSGQGTWNGLNVIYRTAGTEYPDRLPRGFALTRYSSTAWSTLNIGESTSRVYELPANWRRQTIITDSFTSRLSTDTSNDQTLVPGPFCDCGWFVTNITGSGAGGRPSLAGADNGIGHLGLAAGSNSASNEYRFGYAKNLWNGTQQYWEMRWTLRNTGPSLNKLRFGLYSLGSIVLNGANGAVTSGTLLLQPENGVGFHYVGGTDATFFAEVITANSVNRIAITGYNPTSWTDDLEFVITRNAQGLFFSIHGPSSQSGAVVAPQIKHTGTVPSVLACPALYSGAVGSTFQQNILSNFRWELFQP